MLQNRESVIRITSVRGGTDRLENGVGQRRRKLFEASVPGTKGRALTSKLPALRQSFSKG